MRVKAWCPWVAFLACAPGTYAQSPCTVLTDPADLKFSAIGGDLQVSVHSSSGCSWNTGSDAAWLTVRAASAGAGDSQVILHASANSREFRIGMATIGNLELLVSQSGPDRSWEIPGLSFGKNRWSIVRITNPSLLQRTVMLDVYRESGTRFAIQPVFDLQARQILDIVFEPGSVTLFRRIAPEPGDSKGDWTLEYVLTGGMPEGGNWVRVAQAREAGKPDLEVRAVEEYLDGDKLFDLAREASEPVDLSLPVSMRASDVRGRQFYFLNTSDRQTLVALCAENRIVRAPCQSRNRPVSHFVVKPNQMFVVNVKRLTQKYFFVESSAGGKAILAKLARGNGTTRVFSTESSISFGESSR